MIWPILMIMSLTAQWESHFPRSARYPRSRKWKSRKIAKRQSLYSSLGVLGSHGPTEKTENRCTAGEPGQGFARGSGFAGDLTQRITAILYWFEDRLVIRGIGEDMIDYGRQLGLAANKIEQLLLNPGYLALFVLTILLVAI